MLATKVQETTLMVIVQKMATREFLQCVMYVGAGKCICCTPLHFWLMAEKDPHD